MGQTRVPVWSKGMERCFAALTQDIGAGSPSAIARTCVSVVAFRRGNARVRTTDIEDGLHAYRQLCEGVQPFAGIVVETVYPYRALVVGGGK